MRIILKEHWAWLKLPSKQQPGDSRIMLKNSVNKHHFHFLVASTGHQNQKLFYLHLT